MMKSNGRPDWTLSQSGCEGDISLSNPIQQEETFRASSRLAMTPVVEARDYVPDREAIFAQVEGDMELLGELVELFLDSYPCQLEDIRQGIEGADPSRVREAAHSLRGSLGNFQATTAIALAAALEVMGRDAHLDFAPQKLIELEAQLSLIKTALTALRIEVAA